MILEYKFARCYLCSDRKESMLDGLEYTSKMIENGLVDKCVYDCKAALIVEKENVDYVIMEGKACWLSNCFDEVISREKIALHLHNEILLTKIYHEAFDRIIVPSQYIANWWNEEITDKVVKKYILSNCIRTEKFEKSVSNDKKIKKRIELGFNPEDKVILFCGRIIKEKGVRELIDAVLSIRDSSVKLLIIGSDSFAYGNRKEYAANIMQVIQENNERIVYLGYIDNDELPYYYQCADIQAVPSVWEEPFGLVALEGMMSGIPLVITNSGGMIEFVPENAGIIVKKEENLVEQLKEAFLWIFSHRAESIEMARIAKKSAKKYSAENYYVNFCKMIEWWEEDEK